MSVKIPLSSLNIALSYAAFFCFTFLLAQGKSTVSGVLIDMQTKQGIPHVKVFIEGTDYITTTSETGSFSLNPTLKGSNVLVITSKDYIDKKFAITLGRGAIDMGVIYLEKDLTQETADNLILLSDEEIAGDQNLPMTFSLLQASRDVFLNRAAFDFGQAFFRIRGYDSQHGKVLLNGVTMNALDNGRADWNHWGGLNDITRNQDFSNGLTSSNYSFGGVLGVTNINTRPSLQRGGTRISSSYSNRTYVGRAMITHTENGNDKGVNFSVSASRRWGNQGYIDGTLYDAYSFFGAAEYKINKRNSLMITGMLASNRRGQSAAITDEVYQLMGNKYNPYWGYQQGDKRNSRERNIQEPIFMLNHFYTSKKLEIKTAVAYQFGTYKRSRLAYYNAPNPDPTYYRYLPSYYINSLIGANFISANQAQESFLNSPQLLWNQLYAINTNTENQGKASYVLYDDVIDRNRLSFNSNIHYKINEAWSFDMALTYRNIKSVNYAKIKDLLGASFHEDVDPFTNTANDLLGGTNKQQGAIFNYHYRLQSEDTNSFLQATYNKGRINAFVSGEYNYRQHSRDGLFTNERFLDSSFGEGDKIQFNTNGIKGGFSYMFTNRHTLAVHSTLFTKAPNLQNIYVNPREQQQIVPDITHEKISSVDVNYHVRLPKVTGRLTGFYTRMQDLTDVNFFYTDAGVRSDFVQEVITNLDQLYMGLELGLAYKVSPSVKVTGVMALSKYLYANNPNITINFVPDSEAENNQEDLTETKGFVDLGLAWLKDYKLAQGPQKAYALGIEYRDPKYWWVSATTNFLGNNYTGIAAINRTQSFYLNPDTGQPYPEATTENVVEALKQKKLADFYLLNLVGGKSWFIKGKYVSLFASINNLFDTTYKTGGYEQSRNGNYGQYVQDNLSGSPSFGQKYWYGFGRTYFLNLAVSF